MKQIIVREFNHTLEDAKKLKEIDDLTFNDCQYSEREIISISERSQNKIFLAEYDGIAVGFVSLLHVENLHYHGLWVDLVAVNPEFQKMGIGQKLLEYAVKYGRELKVDMVSGLVATNNYASKRIFEKQKFLPESKGYNLFLNENL